MKRSEIITLTVLGLVLALALLATTYVLMNKDKRALSDSAANSALSGENESAKYTDLEGGEISLKSYLGQTLVVHSWASWCPQCASQIRLLDSVSADYPEVVFIAINRAEDSFTAERYLKTITTSERIKLILDPEDHFYGSAAGYAMPETIIYDSKGAVLQHIRGDFTESQLRNTLNLQE